MIGGILKAVCPASHTPAGAYVPVPRPSEAPAEWQEQGPHLVLQCWFSTFLAPSSAFAGLSDPTSQAAQLPGMHLRALGGRPTGKNLRLGVTGQPLWKT